MTSRQRSTTTARYVTLGPGLEFPAKGVRSTTTVETSRGSYAVTVHVVPIAEEGRLVVRSLTVEQTDGGPAVDAGALRDVPVSQLLRDAARDHFREVDAKAVGVHADAEEIRQRGPNDDLALETVAVVYARAHAVGNEPTRAVVDAIGLPRGTAVRWINRARERGFLSEAQRARRGHGQR